LHEPALFDGYAVLDPALSWDNHALDSALSEQLPAMPTKGKTIYIAGRAGRQFAQMGIATVKSIFEEKAPHELHWNITAYASESHDSLKLKATYDALRYAYGGYTGNTIRLVPNGGILVKGKPMFITVDGVGIDEVDLRYTSDGSTPTDASPRIEGPFPISDPEKTTVKLLSNRGVFDRTLPLNLTSGETIAPRRGMQASADWRVEYYADDLWPRFQHARAIKVANTTNTLEFDDVGRDTFAGAVTGNMDIPADGYYVLAVTTQDKARVIIAGKALVEQDGAKGTPYQAFVVPLLRGVYPLRFEFLHSSKASRLDFVVFQANETEPEWWKNKILNLTSHSEH
jgi:hypothetical protein